MSHLQSCLQKQEEHHCGSKSQGLLKPNPQKGLLFLSNCISKDQNFHFHTHLWHWRWWLCFLPIIPDLIIRGLSGQVTLFCIPVISQWREHFSGPSWDWIIANRMLWCWCWSSSRTPSTMWSVHLKPNSAGNIWTNHPFTLSTSYSISPLK